MTNQQESGPGRPPREIPKPPRRISSDQLLQGERRVIIEHEGQDYILQRTRQGRLILTK